MDKDLFDLIDEDTPRFNSRVMNGLAVEELEQAEAYVNQIIRTAVAELAPELQFVRLERCTPRDEYREAIRKMSNRNTVELARSDMYMVKLLFRFNNEDLPPRYLYLPFCRRGGLMTIRGSLYSISPVIADKAISVGGNWIFIPMAWDRMNFYRLEHLFYADNEQCQVPVVWSKIHHYKLKARRTNHKHDVRASTTLPHYLFAKYGVTRAFAEMCNAHVVAGTADEITTERYPENEWVICQSFGRKPRSVKDPHYRAPTIRLAVQRDAWSPAVASMVAGFFYVTDHFPDRVSPDEIDEIRLWRILLGYMVFGVGYGEGKLADDITSHFGSLDNYVEIQTRKRLEEVGVVVEDIYQLFMHLIEQFDHYVTTATVNLSSLYGKRLMVLHYVLTDLTWAIHSFMFSMTSAKKRKQQGLTKEDVIKIMHKTLKPNVAFKISKNHGEVNPVSIPGDNMAFKITTHAVPQESSSGASKKSRPATDDPTKVLDVSFAEVGSYCTMNKSESSGQSKLNPMLALNPTNNEIIPRESIRELTTRTQEMIRRNT